MENETDINNTNLLELNNNNIKTKNDYLSKSLNLSHELTSQKLQNLEDYLHYDADRDQSEVFASISDHFARATSTISNSSMSLNFEQSREELNESNSSVPCGDIIITDKNLHDNTFSPQQKLENKKAKSCLKQKVEKSKNNEEDEALPLPPPPQIDYINKKVANQVAESVLSAVINELNNQLNKTKQENENVKKICNNQCKFNYVRPLSGKTERISSFVYGYGGINDNKENKTDKKNILINKSPLLWRTERLKMLSNCSKIDSFDCNTLTKKNLQKRPLSQFSDLSESNFHNALENQHYSSQSVYSKNSNTSTYKPTNVSPQQIFQSYELQKPYNFLQPTTYFSPSYNFNYYKMTTDISKQENLLPSTQTKLFGNKQFYLRNELNNAHDDIMSTSEGEGYLASTTSNGLGSTDPILQRSSRATIREIPIQRSTSAYTSLSSQYPHTTQECFMPTNDNGFLPHETALTNGYSNGKNSLFENNSCLSYPTQEEYYRKEVLTRTLVTRSTEALSRNSPIDSFRHLPEPLRDELSEEYWYKYSKNIEREERRIKENQERRRKEEEERRYHEEEMRRRWEQQEYKRLERLRSEREKMEKDFEIQIIEREKAERERIERDRFERETAEMLRRQEWEKIERERRLLEENDLEKRRQLERLEKERLERERFECERLELERLERERLAQEKLEKERLERERIEKERIEIEQLEIERIERIKREQREKELKERERQREEAERLERERLETERLERERLELERKERELLEIQRREAEQRERERREDELREQRRCLQEQRERELLILAEREAAEREMKRKLYEKMEQERLDNLRREQERLEFEKLEAERRERQRQEEERREQELLEAQQRARERREQERLEESRREQQRKEEEKREKERWQRERMLAQERERQRILEEQKERERIAALEAAAAERRAQRIEEERLQRNRADLERKANELKEIERFEAERREKERLEEERRLAELRDLELRNSAKREEERREAAEREANRRREDQRSRDRLDLIMKEREEHERWKLERKKLLAEHEAQEKKRQALTSKETLERLTRKPYFSRENLSTCIPEITTKVERQIIERVDRTLWTSDETRHYPKQSVSASLTDRRQLLLPLYDQPSPNTDLEYNNNLGRERIYNPRDDDLKRNNSTRTSKYRAKIEKARKEFLSHSNQSDFSYQNDLISERFRKSAEDLRRKVEYRGPLLQKFNNGEINKNDFDILQDDNRYNRTTLSSYDKVEERNVDDSHRSKSVLDYESPSSYQRQSRKNSNEIDYDTDSIQHSRSKSADYLMDKKTREDMAPPENELQKTVGDINQQNNSLTKNSYQQEILDHELRFKKSVEKLPVPDWYRNYNLTNMFENRSTTPIGGILFPPGMFDKYKDEIEDLRRSRTSLHQIGINQPSEHTKVYSKSNFSLNENSKIPLPGYTVSNVPEEWNLSSDRNSRVIEVADTFIGPSEVLYSSEKSNRYGGRITLEELLDLIFQETKPVFNSDNLNIINNKLILPKFRNIPGIYTIDSQLFEKVIEEPYLADSLLKRDKLYVYCFNCHKSQGIREARSSYVSCKHCYTYYCSQKCRENNWKQHRNRCSFARINTLCKDVIMKVRNDYETQIHMTKVARKGFCNEGRGSVNFRIISAHLAQQYIIKGWKVFANQNFDQLLHYYSIQNLIEQRKELSLIQLCKKYNPNEKFILSVSIIADIEQCPTTPTIESTASLNDCQQSFKENFLNKNKHLNVRENNGLPFKAAIPTNV